MGVKGVGYRVVGVKLVGGRGGRVGWWGQGGRVGVEGSRG